MKRACPRSLSGFGGGGGVCLILGPVPRFRPEDWCAAEVFAAFVLWVRSQPATNKNRESNEKSVWHFIVLGDVFGVYGVRWQRVRNTPPRPPTPLSTRRETLGFERSHGIRVV
jgi:hypothetical protein